MKAPILIVFTLLSFATTFGQTATKRVAYIETIDGSIIKGDFLRGDATTIEIETDNGVQSLKIEKINHIRFVRVNLTNAVRTPGANTVVYKSPESLFYHSSLSCPLANSTAKAMLLGEAEGHTCTYCFGVNNRSSADESPASQPSPSSSGGARSSAGAQELTGESLERILSEVEERAFLESPPRTVVAVANSDTFLIDFKGALRWVKLHGISVGAYQRAEITNELKTQLVKKFVYVRCADAGCSQVYLYRNKSGASLNAELVQAGHAVAASDSKYDVAAYARVITSSSATSSGIGTSKSAPGTDVHVRGYCRKDGTYVRPHTRSAPGTKSGGTTSRGGSRRR